MLRLKDNTVNEKWTIENFICFCKQNLTEETNNKKNNVPVEKVHSKLTYEEGISYWKKEIIKATRIYKSADGKLHFHNKEDYLRILDAIELLLHDFKLIKIVSRSISFIKLMTAV